MSDGAYRASFPTSGLRCFVCNETIPNGERHRQRATSYGGSWAWHMACDDEAQRRFAEERIAKEAEAKELLGDE